MTVNLVIAMIWYIWIHMVPTVAGDVSCKGSAMCGGCKHPFVDLYDLTRNVNDGAIYRDGQQVACASCHLTQQEGTCVFVEGIGDRTVTGADVKAAMEEIRKVPCKYCANADLVHGGKVVVNYVVHGCIKHGSVIC